MLIIESFLEKFYNPLESESVSDKKCFLCGTELDSKNRSDEHIFPSWVQDNYDLWNQKLKLINKTSISYRQLKIPCCWNCNNNLLNPIETTVSKAVSEGIDSVKSLDKKTLYLWLGKILFGLIYKELLLPHDQSNPQKGSILVSDVLYH